MNSPRTKSIEKRQYRILLLAPHSVVCDLQQICSVVLNLSLPDKTVFFVKFTSDFKKTFVRADKVNTTTLSFVTPGNFPAGNAEITLHYGPAQSLLCDYHKPFVFESKIDRVQQLLDTTSDPIAFISSSYNMTDSDTVSIDFKLEHALKCNIPCNINLLKCKKNCEGQKDHKVFSSLKNPTLLHFAARYNLVRLCVLLCDIPGSEEALKIANVDGQVPSQLAELSGNTHLAQILSNERNNEKHADSQADIADEIYEQMSAEIYDRYMEFKNSDIYQDVDEADADNELYEDMYTCRRESSNSRKLDTHSSDSAVSCTSSDSRSSNNVIYDQSGAPLPPSDYRVSSKPVFNPLLDELKRKTEGKRNVVSQEITEEVYDFPPKLCHTNPQVSTTCHAEHWADIYDVPPDRKTVETYPETYDIPCRHSLNSSYSDESYDSPTNPNHSEVYDAPPAMHRNTQPLSPNAFPTNELYDTPATQDVYEMPPSQEVYDVPPSQEVYEMPPSQEVYDIPPTQEVYQIPPSKRLPHMPPPQKRPQEQMPPQFNSYQVDVEELYDDVSPLKPRHHVSEQDLSTGYRQNEVIVRRNAKRFSEPTMTLSASEQQRLTRLHISGRPILPPRNVTPARNPKVLGRSIPPPPLPHRR